MSWLDDEWDYRYPILIDNLVAATAAIDVIITIPPELSEFWDNIETNGEDLRITDADGRTALVYDLADSTGAGAFSKTNRDGRIEIDGWTPPAQQCMGVVWAYWKAAGSTTSTGLTTFAPGSPRNGYLSPYVPSGDVFTWTKPDAGRTKPADRVAITTLEILSPWLRVDQYLHGLSARYEGQLYGEEISYLQQQVLASGTDDPGRYSEADIRMVGRGHVMLSLDGTAPMVDGTDYTLSLVVATTEGRILNPRLLVQCRDTDEA